MEQLDGMAKGANLPPDEIYALNLPVGVASLTFEEECSNVIMTGGTNGPLWGKNNDGGCPPGEDRRPVCALKIYPDDGVPAICFTFCGWLSGGDMINAEGVAVGHSSVGSRFAQSPYNVSALHWLYQGMLEAKSAIDYARHITSLPLYGKGFSQVTVDKDGRMFSGEICCPLTQIRWPEPGDAGMDCVNHYQLPALKDVTMRTEAGLKNSIGRNDYLQNELQQADGSLEHMQHILTYHGEYSICRHGGKDLSHTEYSMIGIPAEGRVLYQYGYPCKETYKEIAL